MAKFCGKCGSPLDDTTGLCPNCNKDKAIIFKKEASTKKHPDRNDQVSGQLNRKDAKKKQKEEKKAAKKAVKKEKRKAMTFGQKLKRFIVKLLLWLLLAAIVVSAAACALAYFGIIDVPAADRLFDHFHLNKYVEDVDKDIPDTDTDGFTYYSTPEDNIVTDEGVMYANNEILVTLKSKDSKAELESYLKSIGGKIVGEITEFADYQILLDKELSYKDMMKLVDELNGFEWVSNASPNYALDVDTSYVPDDKEWTGEWGDIPGGKNWGMEAIDAPGAWEYKDQLTTVNIGIFDVMFDEKHGDLNFAERPLGNAIALDKVKKGETEWDDHGTHVSGTAAAAFDNGNGVTGASVKANLYGASCNGLGGTLQAFKTALYYLIAAKDCSVVNISLGYDSLAFNASRKCEIAQEALKQFANGISEMLQELIDTGYQFVICKAAGNQNEVIKPGKDDGYQYFLKDDDDDVNPFDYLSYSEYLDYLKGEGREGSEQTFSRYKDRKEEIKSRLVSGNVGAENDVLGAIENQQVEDRIIMVGAIQDQGTHKDGFLGLFGKEVHNGYKIAAFSACGERVDIVAPGVDIQSTIKNGYGYLGGTSMASPHVAGVAGLIFSANPDLKGEDVKKIICDSAVGSYGSEQYGLLNAKAAVEAALNYEVTAGEFETGDVPDDAVEFNGHYYYAYNMSDMESWEKAREYCKTMNGYLAAITSKEENTFLYNYIKSRGYEGAYFGLADSDEEGSWKWCTGEAVSYTNWHDGEPNGNTSENYAMFFTDFTDGTWNDDDFAAVDNSVKTVEIRSAISSSTLNKNDKTYLPDLINDDDASTAWSEGVDGYGVGETIRLNFDQAYEISSFTIETGFQNSQETYNQYSRPAALTLTYQDGTSETLRLTDTFGTQTVTLKQPVMTDCVTLRIDDVYHGSDYDDTMISGINFQTEKSTLAFICEWGDYTLGNSDPVVPVGEKRTTSDERDIVLVLDISGSMSGSPMDETKKASINFIDTILESDASIGVVTYDDSATMCSDFSINKTNLAEAILDVSSGGGTNIEAGLEEACSMLNSSNAKKKIIVLMSDGCPNEGKEGDELVEYAKQIKNDDIYIYTLGFFDSLSNKSSAQSLMESIASDGCHYEVSDANDLVFFFGDIADQINGQKYIYVRIACPVDVTVSYEGETLCSNEESLNTRTDFGSLTFEESEENESDDEDNIVKILRLKEGADYDIRIDGTGRGFMDYTIGFMDENGEYSDLRKFENIKISTRTSIDTVASVSPKSVLNVDSDGDGKYDLKYKAGENERAKEIGIINWLYVAVGAAALLLIIAVVIISKKRKKAKKRIGVN